MTMLSNFDPEAFLNATQTEVNEKRELVPPENPARPQDGLYVGIIKELRPPKTGVIEKGDRAGEPWMMVNVPIEIEIPQEVQDSKGLPAKMTFTDGGFIDLLPGGKGIDNSKGRNAFQKRYRDALDKNKPGDTWSWKVDAPGRPVLVRIKHEMNQNGDGLRDTIGGVFRFQ